MSKIPITGTCFVADLSEAGGLPQAVFTDIDEAKRWCERECKLKQSARGTFWDRQTRTARDGRPVRYLFLNTGPEEVAAIIREVPLNPGAA